MKFRIKPSTITASILGFLVLLLGAALKEPEAADAPGGGTELFAEMQVRGLIVSDTRTVISSELAATITDIDVNIGDRFEKDEILIILTKDIYLARLRRTEVELQSARQHLQAKKRLRELKSVSELDVLESQVNLAKIEAELKLLRIKLDQCTIRAPFNGRVIERLVSNYQYVQEGTPLLEIIDDSKLSMQMLIPSSWIRGIKLGQNLEIHVDELNADFPATVSSIGAVIDSSSQTLELRAAISGHHQELLAGMSGSVTFSPAKE